MAKTRPNIMAKRLGRLVKDGFISDADKSEFLTLESFVENGKRGERWEEWLVSFRQTNGTYIPLLKKVIEGMKAINEPYANAKYREFMCELGTMTPGVYSNPWDMTLDYLDAQIGNPEEVARFYGL